MRQSRESRMCRKEGSEGEQVAAVSCDKKVSRVGCFGFLT